MRKKISHIGRQVFQCIVGSVGPRKFHKNRCKGIGFQNHPLLGVLCSDATLLGLIGVAVCQFPALLRMGIGFRNKGLLGALCSSAVLPRLIGATVCQFPAFLRLCVELQNTALPGMLCSSATLLELMGAAVCGSATLLGLIGVAIRARHTAVLWKIAVGT